jgi:hypothetical protein
MAKWFRNVVVGAEIKPENLVLLAIQRTENDDRDRAPATELLQEIKPIGACEVRLDYDERWLRIFELLDRRGSIMSDYDVKPRALEREIHNLDEISIVINNEKRRHG